MTEELLRGPNETDDHLQLRRQILVYDLAISKQAQLERVSLDVNGLPNLALVKQRWQLELLRTGAIFELRQLETPA